VSHPIGLPAAGPGVAIQRISTVIETMSGPLRFQATAVAGGHSLLLVGMGFSGAEGYSSRTFLGTGAILHARSLIEAEARANGFKTVTYGFEKLAERPGMEPRRAVHKKFTRDLD